jgi:hypothetical protein
MCEISADGSRFVTVEPGEDVYSASNANEVDSVENCMPQWLHPSEHGSRR